MTSCFFFIKALRPASTWAVREAHLSSLLLTSERPEVCPRAPRARSWGDICEEEELSKFPREGKVVSQRAKRKDLWSFGKAEYRVLLVWSDTFAPGASKNTMAARFVKGISLTSLLCLCCCVLAEKKGMSGSYIPTCTWRGLFVSLYSLLVRHLHLNLTEITVCCVKNKNKKAQRNWIQRERKKKFLTGSMFSPCDLKATTRLQ